MNDDALDKAKDAAVARIFEQFPELQSTKVELLRMLLGYAWLDGYREYATEKARALEAELILRGGEL